MGSASVPAERAAHSSVGASVLHRRAACPGSRRMEAGKPDSASPYAAEGTVAHALGEGALRRIFEDDVPASVAKSEYRRRVGEYVTQGAYDVLISDEMCDAVDVYIDVVYASHTPGSLVFVEQRYDLSHLHPELFGTGDCLVYSPSTGELLVYDYKHGQGHVVDPVRNPQLLFYALGALHKVCIPHAYPVTSVSMRIVQPRGRGMDKVRAWDVDAMELAQFQSELLRIVRATEEPDAPLHPGDHCRFCKAEGTCVAKRDAALAVAKHQFRPVESFAGAELADLLHRLPTLESWIKALRQHAHDLAERGDPPPGWKLVDKRAVRKWAAPERDVAAMLADAYALSDDDIYAPREVQSVARIEAVIGKAALKGAAGEAFRALIVQQSSGRSLAPDDDARPAAVKTDAASQFLPVQTK